MVNEGRIHRFGEDLKAWSFEVIRALGTEANVGRFRNEFRDICDSAFPWAMNEKTKRDEEKPWLEDMGLKLW